MKKTTLYVKTHNETGLKYFGKTTSKNPISYIGSGIHWKRHIKKHGNNVSTEIIGEFEDRISLQLFAYEFSVLNRIVESDEWANLKIENGLDGGWDSLNNGSEEHRNRTSKAAKRCHELHPEIRLNMPKSTSESALKGVNTSKKIYGENHFKRIGALAKPNIKKLAEAQTGMRMINNGIKNTFVKEEELNAYLSNGWTKGRLNLGKITAVVGSPKP